MFQSLELIVGERFDLDVLHQNLTAFGYERVNRLTQVGEFCQIGEILQIFPEEFDSPLRIDFDEDRVNKIASMDLLSGRSIWQHKIIIVLPRKKSRHAESFNADIPLTHFVDVKKGDYVVHNYHGIGRFLGLEEIETAKGRREHLIIEYQGGDKLFVPKHDIRLVQKYVSFNKRPPRIYQLGSKEWKRVRTLIQKRLQRMAAELLHTQALRASQPGYAFSPDTDWQKDFEKGFPFQETPDQIKSMAEVKRDMESAHPMDRLLCGDVGYGKTEVALRAVFKAVMDNKQAAVLVPTTVLAEQHYVNFAQRLKNFPLRVGMLSRFRTKHEQQLTINGLADGSVDVVIGTHRLLSKDVAFKDLGLIVIDEEQRFGVAAKEKLKRLRLLADVLTLTATPIPRTLHMALVGARDMSVIQTAPANRIAVQTQVIEFDETIIRRAIQREIARKGQVFFLHNRVADIQRIAKIIKDLVPESRIAVGHGQMSPRQLEEVMLRFFHGEVDVLVCTTIVESGIDIPNANTLIVNRADRFGLADLHQLRGRVGRANTEAYAYFVIPRRRALSEEADARIEAIEKYSGLGAGFQIAFEDMNIRGAGNILGQEQSGYIAAVGFDLYCRLLKESVEHLKNQG
ncbi:MAG: transcription-repair coupling factor [Candidatus Omnitrophica bacterium]|nr:transcription-repair coupling factor [Candidatus Omnitrophota bacterium]